TTHRTRSVRPKGVHPSSDPPARSVESMKIAHILGRTSVAAVLGTALALTASACSTSSSSGDSASGSSGSGKVGYSESFLTDPFQVQLVKQIGQQATSQ